MKKLIVIAVLALAGCGTVQEQTLQYCDTTTKKLVGIPVSRNSQCRGVSNSDTGTGITTPDQLPSRG